MKVCIVEGCNKECEKGRRYCREHYLARKREQQHQRDVKTRGACRTKYDITCILCGKLVTGSRKSQKLCAECNRSIQKIGNGVINPYKNAGGAGYCWLHRRIAERVLNKKLGRNEELHHLDGNPENNSLDNLIVMSRSAHGALHNYLKLRCALASKDEPTDDLKRVKWQPLIVPTTLDWLKTEGVEVLRLHECTTLTDEQLCAEFESVRSSVKGVSATRGCKRRSRMQAHNTQRVTHRVEKRCMACGKVFTVSAYTAQTRKYCSYECVHKAAHRFDLSADELLGMFKEDPNYTHVANRLGVSDNAVKKRCKKLGVYEEVFMLIQKEKVARGKRVKEQFG